MPRRRHDDVVIDHDDGVLRDDHHDRTGDNDINEHNDEPWNVDADDYIHNDDAPGFDYNVHHDEYDGSDHHGCSDDDAGYAHDDPPGADDNDGEPDDVFPAGADDDSSSLHIADDNNARIIDLVFGTGDLVLVAHTEPTDDHRRRFDVYDIDRCAFYVRGPDGSWIEHHLVPA